MTQQRILLATGTNEVEMLEFLAGSQRFGVNILKLRQFLEYRPKDVTPIHLSGIHPAILGTLQFRGTAITVVDLAAYLAPGYTAATDSRQIIMVCEFNSTVYGFRIEALERIHRIRWDEVQVAGMRQGSAAVITGVFSVAERDILILDFESIMEELVGSRGSDGPEETSAAEPRGSPRDQRAATRVMLVDDSHTARRQISELLTRAGYQDMLVCSDGEQALEGLRGLRDHGRAESFSGELPQVVITDIEMPRMDGLTLCRRIKEEMPDLSVLILSSMISEQIAAKCEQVAADGSLSKADSARLIALLDQMCAT